MRKIIYRNIEGKKVLILFILTNAVYLIMLMITIPLVINFSEGMKLLDMMPAGYDAEYVRTLFNTLGEKGRHAYLFNQIPIDMIYPFLFGVSYSLVLAYFLNKLNKLHGLLFYFCLLPIAAGLFDYLENVGIITMLTNNPDFSNSLATTTNIFTILKSALTTIYFVILFITLVVVGIKYIKNKNINVT